MWDRKYTINRVANCLAMTVGALEFFISGGVGQALPRGGDSQVPEGGVEVGGEHLGVQGVV